MEEQVLLLAGLLFRQSSRCAMYALRAEKDNQAAFSILFQAIAESHYRQAQRFLTQARGPLGTTHENIAQSQNEEIPGLIERYEVLVQNAKKLENKALLTGCQQSVRVERMNNNLLNRLQDNPEIHGYHVCNFCGFVARDSIPASCPVCTAPETRFISFVL